MNFVFFIPDELRAESVACYGHPLAQTPNFDRVAAEGVRFEQCHVQHSVCTPSRCSLMTGWYPHVSGHRTLWHMLQPHEPSLFRYLKEAGYDIAWFGKNDLYAQAYFPGVVDHLADPGGGHTGPNIFQPDETGYFSFLYEPFAGELHETGDMRRVQAGIDFLKQRRPDDAPFMLYLPLSLPHPPYACPQPFHDSVNPAELPPLRPPGLADKPDYFRLIRQYRELEQLPDEVMAKVQAVYLGSIGYTDWMLGQLLAALDETGLAEVTCLVVTSDHGDWAGDYGLVEKWPSALDDTLTRVPLIVRAPGNIAGHTVAEPVELFDVMATTLELAGVQARHTHFAHSLVPQLKGTPGDPARAVYAEGGYDPHEAHCFEGRASDGIFRNATHIYYPKGTQQQKHPLSVCRATMIRTLEHKLVRRPLGVSELYDLCRDPRELRNVYDHPAYASIRTELEAQLLNWYIHTADVTPTQEDPRRIPER